MDFHSLSELGARDLRLTGQTRPTLADLSVASPESCLLNRHPASGTSSARRLAEPATSRTRGHRNSELRTGQTPAPELIHLNGRFSWFLRFGRQIRAVVCFPRCPVRKRRRAGEAARAGDPGVVRISFAAVSADEPGDCCLIDGVDIVMYFLCFFLGYMLAIWVHPLIRDLSRCCKQMFVLQKQHNIIYLAPISL